MRYALLALMLVGCADNPTAWQQAMRATGEEVTAKQDESLTILRENTNALAAIKSQIDAIKIQSETLKSQEVIESALEPQETERDSKTPRQFQSRLLPFSLLQSKCRGTLTATGTQQSSRPRIICETNTASTLMG